MVINLYCAATKTSQNYLKGPVSHMAIEVQMMMDLQTRGTLSIRLHGHSRGGRETLDTDISIRPPGHEGYIQCPFKSSKALWRCDAHTALSQGCVNTPPCATHLDSCCCAMPKRAAILNGSVLSATPFSCMAVTWARRWSVRASPSLMTGHSAVLSPTAKVQ